MKKYFLTVAVFLATSTFFVPAAFAANDPYVHHFVCKTDKPIADADDKEQINTVTFSLVDLRNPKKISFFFENEEDPPIKTSPEDSYLNTLNENFGVRIQSNDTYVSSNVRDANESIKSNEETLIKLNSDLKTAERDLQKAKNKSEREKIEAAIKTIKMKIGWATGENENSREEITRLEKLWSLKGPLIRLDGDGDGFLYAYLMLSENSDFRRGYALIDLHDQPDTDYIQVAVTCERTWTKRKDK